MRLSRFSVRKYRSITDTHVIELAAWTVLLGPNNEGKSNLVRALATALSLAQGFGSAVPIRRLSSSRGRWSEGITGSRAYDWDVDFPVGLRDSEPGGESIFKLWFELSPSEKAEFKRLTGTRLQAELPLEIRAGRARSTFHVRLKGPAAKALQSKQSEIGAFLRSRLEIAHIPAVRTAQDASDVVERLVATELIAAEGDRAYQAALRKINELQAPILEGVALAIEQTLKEFLPNVRGVSVSIPSEARSQALRHSVRIMVDDGTATPLSYKGDGAQSLAALSLIRSASEARAKGRDLILAVEEPEAHLHPGAVHQLRVVLRELADRSQVVMTTHHPAFVDRARPSSNVIVQAGRARPAKTIHEIRDCLGIEASDNLRNAQLVLLLEGDSDRTALGAILPTLSPSLRAAMESGALALESASGAQRIPAHAAVLKGYLCEVHVAFDFDEQGRAAARKCTESGHLAPAEYTFMSFRGASESELEDVYRVTGYAADVQRHWNVRLPSPEFNRARSKWSGRMAAAFHGQGQDWESHAAEVKLAVAQSAATAPNDALDETRRGPLLALVARLEERLAQ